MSVKRVLMVSGLSAAALMAAVAVDHGDAVAVGAPLPAAGLTTSTTSYSFAASPTVHATASGKCVKSSPQC